MTSIVAILCNIRGKQEARRTKEEKYNPLLEQKINLVRNNQEYTRGSESES